MNPKKFQIKIESILGGHSPLSHFSRTDQYLDSIGIDPFAGASNSAPMSSYVSGLIRPQGGSYINNNAITSAVKWIEKNPKNGFYYLYDAIGSTWTVEVDSNGTPSTLTALSDGGSMVNASGNGMAYYDNYIYFAKNTTIARYGPLNGTPTFDGDYWVTTLGKTVLVNTTYATTIAGYNIELPNHVMHRHSDGKLYFTDVVDNKGTIHIISTTKTTAEGDTDDGSTYSKLQFGYGLWPTNIESYGSNLVFGLYEGSNTITFQNNAKLAFWDTTSDNFNQIIWVEFPDQIINAVKNLNGTLYFLSTNYNKKGFRLSRYVGGNTIETVLFYPTGEIAIQSSVIAHGDSLYFSIYQPALSETELSNFSTSITSGVFVYKVPSNISNGGIYHVYNSGRTGPITALNLTLGSTYNFKVFPIVVSYGGLVSYVAYATNNSNAFSNGAIWWSQIYKIGQRFRITKIILNFTEEVQAGVILVPKVYIDDGTSGRALRDIDFTVNPGAKQVILRPENLVGFNNFWLGLLFQGSKVCTISLPITIEYELIDD